MYNYMKYMYQSIEILMGTVAKTNGDSGRFRPKSALSRPAKIKTYLNLESLSLSGALNR